MIALLDKILAFFNGTHSRVYVIVFENKDELLKFVVTNNLVSSINGFLYKDKNFYLMTHNREAYSIALKTFFSTCYSGVFTYVNCHRNAEFDNDTRDDKIFLYTDEEVLY